MTELPSHHRERGRARLFLGLIGLLAIASSFAVAPSALAAPPDNDSFGFADPVDFLPYETTVNLAEATRESGEAAPTSCDGVTAPPVVESTVWFKFHSDSSATLSASTSNHAYFTTMVTIYSGSSLPSLVPLGCARGYGPNGTSVPAARNADYYIQVGIPAGENKGTVKVSIDRRVAPNEDFEDAATIGSTPFSVTRWPASHLQAGEPQPSCLTSQSKRIAATVWYRYDTTDPTQFVPSLRSNDEVYAGIYRGTSIESLTEVACLQSLPYAAGASLERFAPAGTRLYFQVGIEAGRQSGSFTFTLSRLTRPSNDDLSLAKSFYGPIEHSVSTNLASDEPNELRPAMCAAPRPRPVRKERLRAFQPPAPPASPVRVAGASVWYRMESLSGNWETTLSTAGSDYDTVLAVYRHNSDGSFTEVACNDDSAGAVTSSLVVPITAHTSYFIQLSGRIPPGASEPARGLAKISVRWVNAPRNDDFGQREVVGTASARSGTNRYASTETGEQTTCGTARFTRTVWYWTSLSAGTYELDTSGSTFDTVLMVYTTPPNAPSTNVRQYLDCNDDAGTPASLVRFTSTDSRNFFFQVGGKGGAMGDLALVLRKVPASTDNDAFESAERIPALPFSKQESMSGSALEAQEPASCSDGGGSRWYRFTPDSDMTLVLSATGADATAGVYTLPEYATTVSRAQEVACAPSGVVKFAAQRAVTYYLRVESDPSNSLTVRLVGGTPPANDVFGSAEPLNPGDSRTADTTFATVQRDEPTQCGGGSSVWYKITPATPTTLVLDTVGTPTDAILSVHTGTDVAHLTNIACEDQSPSERLKIRGGQGTTYFIRIATPEGTDGPVKVSVTGSSPPANDDFSVASPVSIGQSYTGNEMWATLQPSEATSCGSRSSVWYRYDNTTSDPVTIVLDSSGSTSDVVLSVYTGVQIGALSTVVCEDRWPSERVKFSARGNTSYFIQVGSGDEADEGAFTMTVNGSAPPTNDNVQQVKVVVPGAVEAVNNTWATDQRDEPHPCGAYSTVWYKFTPVADITVELNAIARDGFGDVVESAVAVMTGNSFASFATTACDGASEPAVRFLARAGTPYFFQVGTDAELTADIEVRLETGAPPANDAFDSADGVVMNSTRTAQTQWATDEVGEPHSCGTSRAVWYRYEASSWDPVTFDTVGSRDRYGADLDASIAVYTGPQLNALSTEACDDSYPFDSVTIDPVPGRVYFIQVGSQGTYGQVQLNVRPWSHVGPTAGAAADL